MTDRAYRAKEWLTRNDGLIEELKAEHDTLLMMSGKVNSAVAAYETDGANHRDIEAAIRGILAEHWNSKLYKTFFGGERS